MNHTTKTSLFGRPLRLCTFAVLFAGFSSTAAHGADCAWGGTFVSTQSAVDSNTLAGLREAAKSQVAAAGIICKDMPQLVSACSNSTCAQTVPTPPNVHKLVVFRLLQVGEQYRYDSVFLDSRSKKAGIIAQGSAASLSGLTTVASAFCSSIKSYLGAYQRNSETHAATGGSGGSIKAVDPVTIGLIVNGYDQDMSLSLLGFDITINPVFSLYRSRLNFLSMSENWTRYHTKRCNCEPCSASLEWDSIISTNSLRLGTSFTH